MVDRHHHRHAEFFHVLHVAAEIGAALLDGCDILRSEIILLDAAVHLHRPHGCDDDGRVRLEVGLAALDVEEFFRPQIRTEAGFGDDVVGDLQRRRRCHHGVAAMSDIGERPAMHEGRIVFERLHQIGLHRVLEQHGHRPVGLDVAAVDRRLVAPVGDHDGSEPLLQILEIPGETQDRHHFRRHRDVEPGLAREAVGDAAEIDHNIPERPVVHVHHPAPDDPARVDFQLVAPVDVVVDHRREQVVGAGDGMKIAGEMQVHLFHRHDLRHAAARGPALHAEIRPQRSLADADHCLLADAVEPVAQPHRGRGLALAGRRRVDRGDQDQLAVLLVLLPRDEIGGDLRLVMTVGNEILKRNAKLLANLLDRLLVRRAGNLDIGLVLSHGVVFLFPTWPHLPCGLCR